MYKLIKIILIAFSLLFTATVFSAGSTFVDPDTNLEWQILDDSHFKVDQAMKHCTQLSLKGNNWRLPNVKELISLIDFKGAAVQRSGERETVLFIKAALLDDTPTIGTYYWSSTSNIFRGDDVESPPVLVVSFNIGETTRLFRDQTDTGTKERFRTRCVRNAQP